MCISKNTLTQIINNQKDAATALETSWKDELVQLIDKACKCNNTEPPNIPVNFHECTDALLGRIDDAIEAARTDGYEKGRSSMRYYK